MDGPLGWTLGFAYGLQFHETSYGKCYSALESEVFVVHEIANYLQKIYIPENWGNMMLAYRDGVDFSAQIYAECQLEQLFNTMGGIFSKEGSSTFITRATSSLVFEIPGHITKYQAATTDFERSR